MVSQKRRGCSHRTWWINRPALCKSPLGRFFVLWQSSQATSTWSESPTEGFCGHLHPYAHDMTRLPQACVEFKRKPVARDTRAPRAPSIVGQFCRQPSQESVDGSVAPPVCPLVLAAAQASSAARHGDGQSDSRRATTPERPTAEGTVAPSPRCGVRALRLHDGPSDSPAR